MPAIKSAVQSKSTVKKSKTTTKSPTRARSQSGPKPAAKSAAKTAKRSAPKTTVRAKNARSSKAATKTAPKVKLRGELGGPDEKTWREYAKTHNPELRNGLMEKYLPVVNFIAERLLLTLPRSIDVDDLKSSGVFGLMDAIDGFDIDRGIKFKTYCSTRVRGAILDELRSQDWVPRLVRLRAHQITRAQASLEAAHGRSPTHVEMADELGVSLADYTAITEEARAHSMHSLSETWDDGSGDQSVEKVDIIRDRRAIDPAEVINQEDVMRSIIRSLNRREKQIILMYYRDGLTMKQVGEVLELTESRVCQIHSNVMKKLKVHLEEAHQTLLL